MTGRGRCAFCVGQLEGRSDSVYCGQTCRQRAFRLRRRRATDARAGEPMRFAYADPPYPGMAKRCYGREPSYAGEVDHAALVAELEAGFPDGWALSTSAEALRDVLPLCPRGAHLCPWVKCSGVSRKSRGLHNAWEALIVVRGRQVPPGVRDWLRAKPAIRGGTLVGRKPIAFCAWLFDCLGMAPGDELVDLFPGTGIIGQSWAVLSSGRRPSGVLPAYPSLRARHASPEASCHASLATSRDASSAAGCHASAKPSPLEDGDASPLCSGDG